MTDPRIESRDAFTVVGLHYEGPADSGEFSQLWESLGERWEEFESLATSAASYGVLAEMDQESGRGEYVAGVEADPSTAVPDGASAVEIPAANYAVFETSLEQLGETINAVYRSWLPESDYRRTGGPEFERYDDEFDPEDEKSTFEYWIPVAEDGE